MDVSPVSGTGSRIRRQFVSLEALLQTADVVSLHVRLTEESQHLIGENELATMKQGALLINVARGGVVDTDALISALNSGHLGGAAIDVYDQEPLAADHPLLTCEQVILTPHCADMTPEGVELLNEGAVDNIIAFLEGNPQNVVV